MRTLDDEGSAATTKPPIFRLVEQHAEELRRVYPEPFAKQHGPLRRRFLTGA